jgi:hypothetical protein
VAALIAAPWLEPVFSVVREAIPVVPLLPKFASDETERAEPEYVPENAEEAIRAAEDAEAAEAMLDELKTFCELLPETDPGWISVVPDCGRETGRMVAVNCRAALGKTKPV